MTSPFGKVHDENERMKANIAITIYCNIAKLCHGLAMIVTLHHYRSALIARPQPLQSARPPRHAPISARETSEVAVLAATPRTSSTHTRSVGAVGGRSARRRPPPRATRRCCTSSRRRKNANCRDNLPRRARSIGFFLFGRLGGLLRTKFTILMMYMFVVTIYICSSFFVYHSTLPKRYAIDKSIKCLTRLSTRRTWQRPCQVCF